MNGYEFNVNMIKSWGARNDMVSLTPSKGEMILFSSFLVHGLACNWKDDETRVSLEFRLFGET